MLHPKYRPDIDGLRALAVLSVVIFHFFPYRLPGGFVGVDIFFVISGYLITGIITSNLEKNTFSFRDFYVRRIRRIFPALLVVIAACLIAGWYLLLSDEFQQLGKHMATAGVFVVNLALWQEAGYFDTASTKKILLHLWSLGIEEQFYIFWPFIVWALSRHGRSFLVPSIALTLVSFIINMLMVKHYPAGDFYSPFSRFWELSIGAILASLHQRSSGPSRWPTLVSAAGLVLIATALVAISAESAFPGGWALLPVVGAALIIAAGPTALPNRLLLANRPAVFIGRISYPLYLWHWPLLAFGYIVVHVSIPDRNTRLAMMAASFVLAWLTTRFVEPQFRFKRDRLSLSLLCGGNILLVVLGVFSWRGALPPRHNDTRLAPIMQAIGEQDYPPAGFKTINLDGTDVLQKGTSPRKTLFVGDSHMQQYAARIDFDLASMRDANTAVLLTHSSCAPVKTLVAREGCPQMLEGFARIAMRPDVDAIVLGGSWESYLFETAGSEKNFKAEMIALLTTLTRHKRVFLILDNPQGTKFDPKNAVDGSSRFGDLRYRPASTKVPRDPKEKLTNSVMQDIARQSGATALDPVPLLCQAEGCATTMDDGHPIYRDSGHLRSVYVRRYAGFLDQTLHPVP